MASMDASYKLALLLASMRLTRFDILPMQFRVKLNKERPNLRFVESELPAIEITAEGRP